jgi:hypothetical protein
VAAGGASIEEIEEIVGRVQKDDYFRLNFVKLLMKGVRAPSMYRGDTFRERLSEILPDKSFAELEVPFFCNALDELDLVLAEIGLVELEIQLHRAQLALRHVGGAAGKRQHDADLHRLGGGTAGEHERRQRQACAAQRSAHDASSHELSLRERRSITVPATQHDCEGLSTRL